MKRITLAFFISFAVWACGKKADSGNQNASAETQTEATSKAATTEAQTEPRGTVFRCDGFYNGIASEYLQVDFDSEKGKINGIWYWNTQDEKKVPLKVLKQELSGGEISGMTGELQFPNSNDKISWGWIEDRFNLTHPGDRFQEFVVEQ
jgi:hypothetical protein